MIGKANFSDDFKRDAVAQIAAAAVAANAGATRFAKRSRCWVTTQRRVPWHQLRHQSCRQGRGTLRAFDIRAFDNGGLICAPLSCCEYARIAGRLRRLH